MSVDVEQRHRRIVMMLIGGLLLAMGPYLGSVGVKAAIQANQHNEEVAAYEQQVEANEFWQVVAGEASPAGIKPGDLLAVRLQDRIGEISDGESELPPAIIEFNGPPNEYRGITQELGFNPFNNDGSCVECGTLNDATLNGLRMVKQGRVDEVLTAPVQPVSNFSPQWINFLPFWVELTLVWQIAGWIAMEIAIRRHGDPRMTWRRRDGIADWQELFCFVFAPAYMLWFMLTVNRRRTRELNELRMKKLRSTTLHTPYEELGKAIADLEALGRKRTATDDQNLATLVESRERVIDVIDQSIMERQQRQALPIATSDERIESIMRELTDGLQAYRTGQEAIGLRID